MERNKGNNIAKVLTDYIVLDIETTGLDPCYDEIIELGAIKVCNGIIVDQFQTFVRPSFLLDAFITRLTGITNEMLEKAPNIDEVLPLFIDFIGDSVVLGHNMVFDLNFIYDKWLEISKKEFSNDYLDTMRFARYILPELEHHRLLDLKKYYKIKVNGSHRAIADCQATFELYKKLLSDAAVKNINIEDIGKRHRSHLKASDILATIEPDKNSAIYGKTVVFTGTLERMVRKDAMQMVVNLGGINGDNVNKKTNYLVIGNGDYSCVLKDGKSTKHKKAEDLIYKAADLQIISEDVFFDLIEMKI